MIGLLLVAACGARRAPPTPVRAETLTVSASDAGLVITNRGARPLELTAIECTGCAPLDARRLQPRESLTLPIHPPRGTVWWRRPPGPAQPLCFDLENQ